MDQDQVHIPFLGNLQGCPGASAYMAYPDSNLFFESILQDTHDSGAVLLRFNVRWRQAGLPVSVKKAQGAPSPAATA